MKFKKTTASSLITLLLIAVFFVTGASFASASTVGPTYPPPGGPANPPTQPGQIDDCSVIDLTCQENIVTDDNKEIDPHEMTSVVDSQDPSDAEEIVSVDNSFVDSTNDSDGGSENVVTPIDGGGSYSKPVKIRTTKIDLYGQPLEYGFANGRFQILERNGLYYYQQQASYGYFNELTAKYTQTLTGGAAGYYTFRAAEIGVPYMSRITAVAKNINYGGPWQFGNYTKSVAGWMIDYKIPFLGKIISAPIPSKGTKDVLVYISTTGKNYSWHRRVLFTIHPNKSVTTKMWYVN